jgi:glutamate racemase
VNQTLFNEEFVRPQKGRVEYRLYTLGNDIRLDISVIVLACPDKTSTALQHLKKQTETPTPKVLKEGTKTNSKGIQ